MNAYVFGMNECYGIGKLPTPTLFQYWLDYLFITIINDYEKDVLHDFRLSFYPYMQHAIG